MGVHTVGLWTCCERDQDNPIVAHLNKENNQHWTFA